MGAPGFRIPSGLGVPFVYEMEVLGFGVLGAGTLGIWESWDL